MNLGDVLPLVEVADKYRAAIETANQARIEEHRIEGLLQQARDVARLAYNKEYEARKAYLSFIDGNGA